MRFARLGAHGAPAETLLAEQRAGETWKAARGAERGRVETALVGLTPSEANTFLLAANLRAEAALKQP